MLSTYLPVISAIIVAFITAYVNYRVGKLKQNVDVRTIATSASDALRDDLLSLVDKYEQREKFLIGKIDKVEVSNQLLQETINSQRFEITELRIENRSLKDDLAKLRKELEVFERKVFYVPTKSQEN